MDKSQNSSKPIEKKVSSSGKSEEPIQSKQDALPTKVVVRRLPPNMSLESFTSQVEPMPDHNYLKLGKYDIGFAPYLFSRVYINFIKPEDVFPFREKFDNYVFVDSKGHEYPAVVEFAPFQRIPKHRPYRKHDAKMNTIESDPLYKDFIEKKDKKPVSVERPQYGYHFPESKKNPKGIVMTPLIKFVNQCKEDRIRVKDMRREEQRRRNAERRRHKEEDRRRRRQTSIESESSGYKCSTREFTNTYRRDDRNKFDRNDRYDSKKVLKPKQSPRVRYDAIKEKRDTSESSLKEAKENQSNNINVQPKAVSPKPESTNDVQSKQWSQNSFTKTMSSIDHSSHKKTYPKPDRVKPEKNKYEKSKTDKYKTDTSPTEKSKNDKFKSKQNATEKPKTEKLISDKNKTDLMQSPEKIKPENGEELKSKDDTEKPRLRNKDRPAMAIYRPGMGRYSKNRIQNDEEVTK